MAQKLYLEAFTELCDTNANTIVVTLETAIVLFVLEFVERPSNIQVFLIPTNRQILTDPGIQIRLHLHKFSTLSIERFQSEIASNCTFPVITNENVVIAGLCSVCRAVVKFANESYKYLLGFKESCLLAPSEASPWTKFCEVDILTCTKHVLIFHSQSESNAINGEFVLPNEFGQFESHLNQPVKAHNMCKLILDFARGIRVSDANLTDADGNDMSDINKTNKKGRKIGKKGILAKNLSVEHKFVEGPQISIADIILFPYFWLMRSIFRKNASEIIETQLPLTHKWMDAVSKHDSILNCMKILIEPTSVQFSALNYNVNNTESFTLYKRESKRYKPIQRVFTRDDAIERSLKKIDELGIEILSSSKDYDENINDGDWNLPYDALPEGGNLPENRLKRKKDQLFSLAREIIAIAKDGDRIVDFCSGQGHLAIILAYKLPQCLIYVLDNKEESLMRAVKRVDRLNLTNIKFFQCNLDYFIGDFEIGTSLHACGIASDIVLMHCKQRQANFVCCPCCYGSVNEMPHITFPRSKFFRSNNITIDDYLCIAHCADQGHDIKSNKNNIEKCIQGQYCMDIIDTDRKLYMEECGYDTQLTRLYPEDCTPKNRLLIGKKYLKSNSESNSESISKKKK